MPTDFEIIAGFLSRFDGDEVSGRDLAPPPSEVQEKLAAFARGEMAESDRSAICEAMKENPHWVTFLADNVKKLRETAS
mgnify:CR=1 FL=1